MPTEKVSLTLDGVLLTEARRVVGGRGLSGYVNHALAQQLQHDRLTGLLSELEGKYGPIEPEVLEEVRQEWPAPGETRLRRSA